MILRLLDSFRNCCWRFDILRLFWHRKNISRPMQIDNFWILHRLWSTVCANCSGMGSFIVKIWNNFVFSKRLGFLGKDWFCQYLIPKKYLSLMPKNVRIGLLCILPGICGLLYHLIPIVPDNVTLQNVSDANQIFKQSHRIMRKKRLFFFWSIFSYCISVVHLFNKKAELAFSNPSKAKKRFGHDFPVPRKMK